MENKTSLPENIRELLELIKAHADESSSEEELLGLIVGSSFNSDGEVCDELINHMIGFIRSEPSLSIRDIFEHLSELLPPVEYVKDEISA